MVIVGGTFEFDPELRDKFIESRGDMMRTSRGEAGCIEYTFCADPLDPSRVVLFEKWADQASLDAHIAAQRAAPRPTEPGIRPISSSIMLYDVVGERSL
ncbi:MAG TPA: putative quinol monooxygenase [Ilumatobacteraceae bacterium]|jgi:quinol monooxygenase YgiN|nr:putative quinol monooxygenase [Ilumatobacteraceae bacterium]